MLSSIYETSTHPGQELRQVKTELRSIRDRLKVLCQRPAETLTNEHFVEIRKIKDRVIILQVLKPYLALIVA